MIWVLNNIISYPEAIKIMMRDACREITYIFENTAEFNGTHQPHTPKNDK